MLKQLRLKNYILIDELTVDFDKGLNIITGETGAGKSILINAIDLIFAPRVSKEVIKTGCDRAIIELVLENNKHDLKNFLDENGIEDYGDEIIISKEITQSSIRSKINGSLVNTEVLRQLRRIFVDIHSQNQTYSYLQTKYHILLLDSYGKNSYGNKLAEYKSIYKDYIQMCDKLNNLKHNVKLTESQIEFLKFQINEIESAEIKSDNEDEELKQELDILGHAEKLKELTATSYWTLNGDDNSVLDVLNKIKADISKAVSIDNKLSDFETEITDVLENLKDVSSGLNNYSQNLNNDTQRLNDIQERLYILDKLKNKYGGSLKEVLKSYERFSNELSSIEVSTQNIEILENKIEETKKILYTRSKEISDYRKDFAQILSSFIQEKLTLLELPKARFKINITDKEELSPDGIDNVEFLISTNISEELKPLVKVASGGEISRVMLAIKSIFSENDDIDTVIFDEIDSGISGKTSQSVAEEILSLSKTHQIIVITHQAIIASKADRHFYVKKSQNDVTKVEVYVLSEKDRIMALAELAGGDINDQSVEFARSLITK